MQRNGVGTIIFGKHTFLNGRTRFFERERKKAQIARTSWTLPEDREERAPGHGGGRRPEPCPENFQKSRSEYSIEKGIE